EPDHLAGLSCEYRRLRIAAHLCVSQHIGEVEIARCREQSFRWVIHSFPERLSAIVNRFLGCVFRILCAGRTAQVWYRASIREPHVDVRLVLHYEFTERRAISISYCGLCARVPVFYPCGSLRFDDQRTDCTLIAVLDRIG